LIGLFKTSIPAAVLAATGIILGAVYMLRMYQRVVFGKVKHAENKALKDLNKREVLTLLPIILLIVWIGFYPKPFLKLISATTVHLVEMVKQKHAHQQGNLGSISRGKSADTKSNQIFSRGIER
jgi:NADH-quinone oxidoreductase subunit M